MRVDILAFGAHPDDVELSCSGTLIKSIKSGKSVGLIDLTRGELGSRGTAEIRDIEGQNSAKIMGAAFRKALTFADGFFETNEESLLKIIQIIRTHKPEIVLANTPSDRHPDHARGSELVKRASFLAGLSKIQTIGDNGEIQLPHRPKSVFFYIQDRHLHPHFVVDISDEFQQKVECIKAFKSQFYDPNSKEPETPISSEEFWNFIEGRAREFGRPIAVKYAEGFISERGLIGVDQLFDIY